MVHELSSSNSGTASDIKTTAVHIEHLDEILFDLLGEVTKQPKEYWEKSARRDFYMNAAKAEELGIIDQII